MVRVRSTLLLVVAAAALAVAPGALSAPGGNAAPLSSLARVDVVGSGPLAWRSVAVRVAPSRSARRRIARAHAIRLHP